MIKLTLELIVTMMKERPSMMVIETGMYDLKFKVLLMYEKTFWMMRIIHCKDENINYLFLSEQNSICWRVIVFAPHMISSTNISTLQAKAVTTTVNKIRNDLFSCLFLEVLNSSQLYQNSLDETDLTYVFNYLLRVLTQHVSLVHYSDWFLHHFV